MQIYDDQSKRNIGWWNKNYFFAGTVAVVVMNICVFAFANKWQWKAFPDTEIVIQRMLRTYFNGFSHVNWQHVLLNMLCFFVAGLYLERKTGSFGLVGLIAASGFFSAGTMAMASPYSSYSVGFSGVNYLLYSYIIIDYAFSFQKSDKNKFNMIFGALVVALIYFAMCFNGGTNTVGFEWYPYDLLNNLWHYSSFIGGIFFGLSVQVVRVKTRKESVPNQTDGIPRQ